MYLRNVDDEITVYRDPPGEAAQILWLPYAQGSFRILRPNVIGAQPPGTLFMTYYLTGCKVFAVRGGPIWHIDAQITADEFWQDFQDDDWVEANWAPGAQQNVAFLHRAGQNPALWDLAAHLPGIAPSTYGAGNVGQAVVAGIVNNQGELDLYYQASPWTPLKYTTTKR